MQVYGTPKQQKAPNLLRANCVFDTVFIDVMNFNIYKCTFYLKTAHSFSKSVQCRKIRYSLHNTVDAIGTLTPHRSQERHSLYKGEKHNFGNEAYIRFKLVTLFNFCRVNIQYLRFDLLRFAANLLRLLCFALLFCLIVALHYSGQLNFYKTYTCQL